MDIRAFTETGREYFSLDEIDIRTEVDKFISGEDFGEEKYIPYISRKVRLDGDGTRRRCSCWDQVSNEGVSDCTYCEGMGYLWDESIVPGFTYFANKRQLTKSYSFDQPVGRSVDYALRFITQSNIIMSPGDLLFSLDMTEEGMFKEPLVRTVKYVVLNARVERLDNSQSEYAGYFIMAV